MKLWLMMLTAAFVAVAANDLLNWVAWRLTA